MFSKIFPKIHAEGYKFLVIAGIITIVFYIFSNFLGLIGLLLTIWVYYFFRDPERYSINDDKYLVSPADGLITDISEKSIRSYVGGMNKVSDELIESKIITNSIIYMETGKGKTFLSIMLIAY